MGPRLGGDDSKKSIPDRLQRGDQLAMDVLVAGDDVTGTENVVAAFEIADEAAGLAHQDHAGGHVPDPEVALPKSIEATGGDPGEIEGSSPEAAEAGYPRLQRRHFLH